MLVGDDSFLLAIKLFALLLKHLVANPSVLIEGFVIEVATAVGTLIKIHLLRFRAKSIWAEAIATLLFQCRQYLCINLVFIVIRGFAVTLVTSAATSLILLLKGISPSSSVITLLILIVSLVVSLLFGL